MATLIRSARLGDAPVTLAAGEPPAPAAEAATVTDRGNGPDDARRAEEAVQAKEDEARRHEQKAISRQTLEEIEEARTAARDAGYADGYAEGERRGAAEFEACVNALDKLTAALAAELEDGLAALEDIAVGIAFEAVCKILGAAMREREGVLAAVREAMERVRDQERILLHVSPADHALLRQHWEALAAEHRAGRLELIADDRVLLGGCLIETSGGALDGRLETQLQQLRDTLLAARGMLPE